jgi:tetratricopeptide (TPR) repeat protein
MLKPPKLLTLLSFTLLFSLPAQADLATEIQSLQTQWAKANYSLKDDAQKQAFEILIVQAESVTKQHLEAAESWIWQGIIQSTYAGKAGPLSALGYAKDAKVSLDKALALNDQALNGSAYTSLGILYSKVPGWPIAFGDDEKSEEMLKKAITINPDGIDSNYFYADFLYNQDNHEKAKQHLLKAQKAPARPNRPLADSGRQLEINDLLKKVNEEL